jgi:hypothetical protein
MDASKMAVVRVIALLLLAVGFAWAGTFKLYLKSGDYQLTREYKIDGDRVRYYSTEREQWEEIPVALCDLKKTDLERQRTEADRTKETKLADEEEQFQRKQRQEVERIPMNAGAYHLENGQVKTLQLAESTFVKDKKRRALQMVTPIPIVAGKMTLEIKGEHSAFVVNDDEPEFYLRLEQDDRFGIVQLTPNSKGSRIVENISTIPVTNENIENPKQIPAFQKQMTTGLYKVWPEKPLTPGEYALIEYQEGELNTRIWDFRYQPASDGAK